jgi:cyclophilin family peptidyl-prolyl cis-trans isomerase
MPRLSPLAVVAALVAALGLLAACSGAPATTAPPASSDASASASSTLPATGTAVAIVTDKGSITIELDAAKAPKTVANFVKLVSMGFYDGLRVHRVEAGFVVQAGDPLTKGLSGPELKAILDRRQAGAPKSTDPAIGTGGPGWTIPFEKNDLLHDRGVIAMARSQDPDSAGSQFYITLGPAHFLDGSYVVFGKVTQGMDVVDRLAVGDKIVSATVIRK